MKRTKRIWALMLTLLMTLCLLSGAALAEGEEYYWHSKKHGGKHQKPITSAVSTEYARAAIYLPYIISWMVGENNTMYTAATMR